MQRLIADASKMTDVQKKLGVTVDGTSMSFDNIVAAIAVGAAVTSVIFRALAQRGKREANSPKDAA